MTAPPLGVAAQTNKEWRVHIGHENQALQARAEDTVLLQEHVWVP